MSELSERLAVTAETEHLNFDQYVASVEQLAVAAGYDLVEINVDKPWGAYLRISSAQADMFVEEFFPGLTSEEARLGVDDAELSPKFLIVKPGERLSWQYHDRRAERWRFLTPGAYRKSLDNEQGEMIEANADEVVQFQKGERHRLEGLEEDVVLVAEIWQHSDVGRPSDEDDIVRLSDDYQR